MARSSAKEWSFQHPIRTRQRAPRVLITRRRRKRHCVVSRLNDAVANRIVYELTHGVNAQFEHNSRPMGLYGSDTDPQRRCYFLVALTPRKKLNDLPLSRREPFGARSINKAPRPSRLGETATKEMIAFKEGWPEADRVGE